MALDRFTVQVITTADTQGNVITVAQYSGAHAIANIFVSEFRGQVPGPFVGADDIERYNDAIAKCKADLATKLDQVKLAI
jgi:hypothetical protein